MSALLVLGDRNRRRRALRRGPHRIQRRERDGARQAEGAGAPQKLEGAGLRAPQEDILVRSFGDDGGAVCENAHEGLDGLTKAILLDQLFNGADFVGRRPITADRRIVQGQLLILETYCPDTLDEYRTGIQDLEFDDTIKD